MKTHLNSTPSPSPYTDEEKEAVRQQLARLTETSHFKNSRRYPALLRFIVEETLEGRGEFLKERLLGIRVFDRPVDYDTASDPIVRVTIAEIRKRIAQYYHEEAHDSEMRIELLSGRYEPEFRPSKEIGHERRSFDDIGTKEHAGLQAVPPPGPQLIDVDPLIEMPSPSVERSKRSRGLRWVLAIAVLVVAAGLVEGWRWSHPSAMEELWGPVFATHRPVLMCLPAGAGDQSASRISESRGGAPDSTGKIVPAKGSAATTFLEHESLGENVVLSDVLAAMKIADLMAVHQREYHLRLNVLTTLDDLKQGPTILIGGLDNQWTMRALAPLQFHFAGNNDETYWIFNSQNPQGKQWALDLKTHYSEVKRDYALIGRVHNEQTGELEVIIAGIGMSGTAAAGEFLADPHRVEDLRRRVGSGFKDHDFEAVLSTEVVNGISGSPSILAVAVWQ